MGGVRPPTLTSLRAGRIGNMVPRPVGGRSGWVGAAGDATIPARCRGICGGRGFGWGAAYSGQKNRIAFAAHAHLHRVQRRGAAVRGSNEFQIVFCRDGVEFGVWVRFQPFFRFFHFLFFCHCYYASLKLLTKHFAA